MVLLFSGKNMSNEKSRNMKALRFLFCLTVVMFVSAVMRAGNIVWSVNDNDFQYDMTVYACLELGDVSPMDMTRYDVASFVGDECRGIAEYQTSSKDGKTYEWLYIRIRSNTASGETVTFKARDKSTGQVVDLTTTVVFESMSCLGLPSAPYSISDLQYMIGDVNGDSGINIVDAVCIVNHILEKPNANFLIEASDVNGDGSINIVDAVCIVNIILYGSISPN